MVIGLGIGRWACRRPTTNDQQPTTNFTRSAHGTGRQIQLARLLGRIEPPAFLHHPLIMKSPTQKLSKSDADTGVRELREKGWSAERMIGHAASLAGLIDRETDVSVVALPRLFAR